MARLAAGATALTELNLAHNPLANIEPLEALPRLRHVNVHGCACRLEALVACTQSSSPLSSAQVVPPWVLGRL